MVHYVRRTRNRDVAQYQLNLANNLVALGRESDARAALAAALAADPENPQAHWMLANASAVTSDEHIRAVAEAVR